MFYSSKFTVSHATSSLPLFPVGSFAHVAKKLNIFTWKNQKRSDSQFSIPPLSCVLLCFILFSSTAFIHLSICHINSMPSGLIKDLLNLRLKCDFF